jgi:hypothetical protein
MIHHLEEIGVNCIHYLKFNQDPEYDSLFICYFILIKQTFHKAISFSKFFIYFLLKFILL